MSVEMSQFHQVFFEEAQEHLQLLEQLLMALDIAQPDTEDLNSIFRAAHSIKGGSGIFGFTALADVTHIMENLLDKARKGEFSLSIQVVDVLLSTTDTLGEILNSYRSELAIDWLKVTQAQTILNVCLVDPVGDLSASDDGGLTPLPVVEPDALEGFGLFSEERVSSMKGSAQDDFGLFTAEPTLAVDPGFGLFNEPQLQSPQGGQSISPPGSAELASQPKAGAGLTKKVGNSAGDSTLRVETTKIDSLINLSGELVITQSMLALIGAEVPGELGERLQSALLELERNTREVQDAVMSVRMLPVSSVFNRFPRLVRNLAGKLNKKVELIVEGGATEIDKGMIERLVDPLTHLVRNSLDHGIETAQQRMAMGKTESGTLLLKAEQKGGSIVISISDDGAGLNRDRILTKARENGIMTEQSPADEDVWPLIFSPGFSTAAEVTDVSGRGVGMDVVRRNIEALGGHIVIESQAGVGSTFRIQLPLTLAIVDGMCVAVGEQVFVLPLVHIVESIQPSLDQLKTLSNQRLIKVRGEYLPLLDLYQLMALEPININPDQGIVVLIETSKHRFGLCVDALVGQQQVVIKSLERHYRRVSGVSGATIMGDGSVALILDAESLALQVKHLDGVTI
ncbi:chemotaxis protein CheA [Reinekea forsetii]|jgi:two-component system chemotaxis sensor kinase CheA|uniref:Chemotaxis protein CheA n=3 Tax=Reinekea TaxID=230494 RepID=A0A2K8KQ77_9GAMM|nr:chemotaxis protein CheW [Reinekea forsetii]ATX76908.1 signal transduction sensor histidine kinase CheA [Reinekea forsetii]